MNRAKLTYIRAVIDRRRMKMSFPLVCDHHRERARLTILLMDGVVLGAERKAFDDEYKDQILALKDIIETVEKNEH